MFVKDRSVTKVTVVDNDSSVIKATVDDNDSSVIKAIANACEMDLSTKNTPTTKFKQMQLKY